MACPLGKLPNLPEPWALILDVTFHKSFSKSNEVAVHLKG